MKRKSYLIGTLLAVSLFLPPLHAVAQEGSEVSLGDLARSFRKSKPASLQEQSIIDNDNFSKEMREIEAQRLKGKPAFVAHDPVEEAAKKLKVSSPDGTCSLSFSANAASSSLEPFSSQDLPTDELSKIDGPARIEGSELQVLVHNGSAWNVKEITLALTLVRSSANSTARSGTARLITAADETGTPQEKQADSTVLYHLKGDAAPLATAKFHEPLSGTIDPDHEWHWAILQAKGTPQPKETPPAPPALIQIIP